MKFNVHNVTVVVWFWFYRSSPPDMNMDINKININMNMVNSIRMNENLVEIVCDFSRL